MRKAYGGWTATLLIAALTPAAALAQSLAPGVEKAADLTAPKGAYVVMNDAVLSKVAGFDADKETNITLKRGEHPQVLGEAAGGVWLLVGRNGTGVGYVQRGVLCPADVCKDVK